MTPADKLLSAEGIEERAEYYSKWGADIRTLNGASVDADHSEQTAFVLRALLANSQALASALSSARKEVETLEADLEEAREQPWPKWAEKLLRLLESWGVEYEHDDEISLPDELAEWLHHYASDLKQAAARRAALSQQEKPSDEMAGQKPDGKK